MKFYRILYIIYNNIIDPITQQSSNILSKEGKTILGKYKDFMNGGSGKDTVPLSEESIIPPTYIKPDTSISSSINKILEKETDIKALCIDRINPVNEEYFKFLMKIYPERIKYIHPLRSDYYKYLKCAVEANGICLQYVHPKIFIVNKGDNIEEKKKLSKLLLPVKKVEMGCY